MPRRQKDSDLLPWLVASLNEYRFPELLTWVGDREHTFLIEYQHGNARKKGQRSQKEAAAVWTAWAQMKSRSCDKIYGAKEKLVPTLGQWLTTCRQRFRQAMKSLVTRGYIESLQESTRKTVYYTILEKGLSSLSLQSLANHNSILPAEIEELNSLTPNSMDGETSTMSSFQVSEENSKVGIISNQRELVSSDDKLETFLVFENSSENSIYHDGECKDLLDYFTKMQAKQNTDQSDQPDQSPEVSSTFLPDEEVLSALNECFMAINEKVPTLTF